MKDLIHGLVRHDIEFRTLAPPLSVLVLHQKIELEAKDYGYIQIRRALLVQSPQEKAAFRAGGNVGDGINQEC